MSLEWWATEVGPRNPLFTSIWIGKVLREELKSIFKMVYRSKLTSSRLKLSQTCLFQNFHTDGSHDPSRSLSGLSFVIPKLNVTFGVRLCGLMLIDFCELYAILSAIGEDTWERFCSSQQESNESSWVMRFTPKLFLSRYQIRKNVLLRDIKFLHSFEPERNIEPLIVNYKSFQASSKVENKSIDSPAFWRYLKGTADLQLIGEAVYWIENPTPYTPLSFQEQPSLGVHENRKLLLYLRRRQSICVLAGQPKKGFI